VIFINQIRMKIRVKFWSPETTTWGNALKFYSSQRLDIRRKEKIDVWTGSDKEILWNKTKVKVVKNKIAPPFREAEFDIIYNEWISKVWEILDIWASIWVVKKAWAFYSYGDIKLWQWREKAKLFLKEEENQVLAEEIEQAIKDSLWV
jgi:recombination protein RecA